MIKTAALYAQEGITVRQIVTAGAAIDNDDPAIAAAIGVSGETFFNLINPDDYAMGAYKLSQRHYPLGTGYLYTQPPEEFLEVVVEGTKSHLSSNFFSVSTTVWSKIFRSNTRGSSSPGKVRRSTFRQPENISFTITLRSTRAGAGNFSSTVWTVIAGSSTRKGSDAPADTARR